MTMFIIILNMLILIGQLLLEEVSIDYASLLVYLFGSVPTLVIGQSGGGALSSITSTFMHGGILHLASNMIALLAFGRRVEDVCGPWRFLSFYLLCGIVADVISTMSRSTEDIPGIGASGAIYGVMAAYLILFPGEKVKLFSLREHGFIDLSIHTFWIILFFFLKEIPNALGVLLINVQSSLAHWAHLGGFFAGTLIFLFLRPDAFHRFRNDLPL